jgi:hypothetical protein
MSADRRSARARWVGSFALCTAALLYWSRAEGKSQSGITLRLSGNSAIKLVIECDPPLGEPMLAAEAADRATWKSENYQVDVEARLQ